MGRSAIAFVVGVFLGASLMFGACATGQNVERELADLEQAIMKSAVSGDRETYSAILDPGWRTIDTAGQVLTKDQVLERLFAVSPGPIAEGTIDDVNVRLFDDAAVVTGRTSATARL